jgi:xylulokinase
MRECAEAMAELGQPVQDRRVLGGGAKSKLWRQILCDVLGHPLIKPASEDASLGAAMLAGVASGAWPDWRSALTVCVQVEETIDPDPHAHALYTDLFEVYCGLTRSLAPYYHRLAALTTPQRP